MTGTKTWKCKWRWKTPSKPRCCSSGSSSCSCRTWMPFPTKSTSPWSSTTTMTVGDFVALCIKSEIKRSDFIFVFFALFYLKSHSCRLPTSRLQGGGVRSPVVWGNACALQSGWGAHILSRLESPSVCGAKPGGETSEKRFPEGERATFCGWGKEGKLSVKMLQNNLLLDLTILLFCRFLQRKWTLRGISLLRMVRLLPKTC